MGKYYPKWEALHLQAFLAAFLADFFEAFLAVFLAAFFTDFLAAFLAAFLVAFFGIITLLKIEGFRNETQAMMFRSAAMVRLRSR
jgi:uncharacterized membrane protein YjjP (DUF1212 family)